MLMEKAVRTGALMRFASHVLYEKVTGYSPSDPAQVPSCVTKMSREWLERVLCVGVPGATISDIAVVGGSDGTNTRRALRITYNDIGIAANLPEHVFSKSASGLRTRLQNGPNTRSESEVRFYLSFRPRLNVEAPTALYANYHAPSGRMLIIFPDMVKQGTRFIDPSHHVTRTQAEGMIDLLTTYQAAFWNSPELQNGPWLVSTTDYQHLVNINIPFLETSNTGLSRSAAVLPRQLLDFGKDRLWDLHMKSIELLRRRAHVLTHYDMHVGNWYITADDRMGLTDWSMRFGHWSADLTYMLVSALTIEDRRAWESELLERYRSRLAEAGVPNVPSFEEVWLEYRRQTFHPLYFWLATIGAGILQPDMQPDRISLANLERMGQAVIDLDSAAAVEMTA
jgi:hypothetical protein